MIKNSILSNIADSKNLIKQMHQIQQPIDSSTIIENDNNESFLYCLDKLFDFNYQAKHTIQYRNQYLELLSHQIIEILIMTIYFASKLWNISLKSISTTL